MRLVRKQNVNYKEIICTGKLISLMDNAPLAKLLSKFEGGISQLLLDDKMQKFAYGLLSSFEADGYVKNKRLTVKGQEVINTKKEWKELKGRFKLSVVESNKNLYIVDCKPQNTDDIIGFTLSKNAPVDFFGDYQNNYGMSIKDIRLDSTYFIGNQKDIEIDCIYDYEKAQNTYALELNGKKFEFPENEHTFKLLDNYGANEFLRDALVNYGNYGVEGDKVILNSSSGNELYENSLKEIFANGYFNASSPDGSYEIQGIRTIIRDESVMRQCLMKYLTIKAEKTYCGYGEVAMLISAFYNLFEDCQLISGNTQNIYSSLIEETYSLKDKTAYLRLCAYKDLIPDSIQNDHIIRQPRDFSNTEMSVSQLVKEIVGKEPPKKVTMLTKYAYKNAAISRTIILMSNALKKQYNLQLRLISAKDTLHGQSDIARELYRQIEKND
ncbi:MAG: hypothetical protein K2I23_05845, partial [Clostridia bacterium]|nr:hypothetical protein [Clostridia bacterium]